MVVMTTSGSLVERAPIVTGVDLPKNIRRLVDSEPELRMSALYNIGISAFHQGSLSASLC
jgi:hypothetical protein